MKKELVKDWMSADVVTIAPGKTLPEANQLMIREEIRRLPVVDAGGKLVGIVSLGDVRQAQPSSATTLSVWELNYILSTLRIEKIMTRNPVTVGPNNTVGEAARLMLENRISGLPVVDETDQLIGIITESDIFAMVVLNEWGPDGD